MRERARMLFDMCAVFENNFDKLTRVLSQDHGRTIGKAIGSVRRVIENIESACTALLNRNREASSWMDRS